MTLLTTKSLGVTYADVLFSDLDLIINPGDRIGLVAANGRGKSTLLRCLAGEQDPTHGSVTTRRGLRVGHVTQDIPPELALTPLYDAVLATLDPDQAENESWRVDIVLDDLEVPATLRQTPLGALSGGWQRLAMLARVWVTEPDLLLMDEPTNHLDLSRIGQLQRWLRSLPRDMPVLVASHDRAFLNEVTNRTVFLRPDTAPGFALPYARALVALQDIDAAMDRQHSNDLKQASQLRRQAAKLKNIGINSGSDLLITKTKQLSDRADKIEEAARPAHQDRSAGAIRLGNSGTHARALLTFDPTDVTTPDGRRLFRTGPLWISPGDRVVVLGANGTGKSTLVNLVRAALAGASGPIRAAPSVVPGISDQGTTELNRYPTPRDTICTPFDVGDQRAVSLLAGAGMTPDMQTAPVAKLSGGQRARLAMLVLRLTGPNFYLLDEPTNHLDIEGQEALQTELTAHGAACLLVSHDRDFVRAVANRFWLIEATKAGGRLTEVDSPEPFFAAALNSP